MKIKTSYVLSQSRSFRKAFNRITQRHMVRAEQRKLGKLLLYMRIDVDAVWRDVLAEFKLNRKSRKHIRSLINANKH